MLHNILRQNAVNCVLKRRLTAVGPLSRNKSHIAKVILFTRTTNHLQLDLKVAIMKTSYCVLISRLKNLNTQ